MFPRLVHVALRTPPMPNRGLVILLYKLLRRAGAMEASEKAKPSGRTREMIRGDENSASTGASQ